MITANNNINGDALNVAIVGCGKTGKFLLKLFQDNSFDNPNVNLVAVCDIDPNAEGLRVAKEMDIYTTNDFNDLFKIENLHALVELTNRPDVLIELINRRPKGVGIIDYNVGILLRRFFEVDQKLKTAEQQTALEKMTSEFLIHHTNERIVVLKPDFTIVDTNKAYLKAVNRTRDDVIGSHCYEITHGLNVPCPTSHPELGCPMLNTLRTGESAQEIHEHPVKGGDNIFCDMVTYPVKNQNGEIIRVIEIWRDITEELSSRWEKRALELKSDLEKLVQEDRLLSLGKLVASCVHEINNPIQGLLTFSQLMLDTLSKGGLTKEEVKDFNKFLSLMTGELERCGGIISGLLSFSREPSTEYKDVDLNEILDSVIALTHHKMELQDINLKKNIPTSPLMIRGDVNQLQQVFLNLIFNAIEVMPEGGRLELICRMDDTESDIIVEIKDTGIGINKENLNHIFDPFFTSKREGEGTGLGLSIVYGLVKTHNGEIKVKSEEGEGSSFILTFPAKS